MMKKTGHWQDECFVKDILLSVFHKEEIDNTVGICVDKEIEYMLSADLLNWVAKLFQIP